MPICPRCGKSLTSDQALNYHLNRKFRCGIWNCTRCHTNFNTKHQLNLHEMQCGDVFRKHTHPSTDTLLNVYKHIPVSIIEFDAETQHIVSVSPHTNTMIDDTIVLMGRPLFTVFDETRLQMICKNVCIVNP
jgi:hypothetical protein